MTTVTVVDQPTPIVVPPPNSSEPPVIETLAGIKAALRGDKQPEAKAPEADNVAPASSQDAPVVAKTQETDSGTVDQQQQDKTEAELPKSVQKRVSKENERAQKAIDEARELRAKAEKDLADLRSKPGSEPVKETTAVAQDGRPARPNLDTFEGTVAEYNTALAKYENEYEEWLTKSLTAKLEPAIEQKLSARQREAAVETAIADATKAYGADFPQHMTRLREAAPEGLQLAIGTLENWAGVVAHFGDNPTELHDLVAQFETHPYRAIAALGKLEDRLKPTAAAQAATEKPERKLPEPVKPVGGSAAVGSEANFNDLDFPQRKARLRKQGLIT